MKLLILSLVSALDSMDTTKNVSVYYSGLFGSRERKYQFLSTAKFEDLDWLQVNPTEPYYFFKPKNLDESASYDDGVQLSALFPHFLGGIKTHDDEGLVSDAEITARFEQRGWIVLRIWECELKKMNHSCLEKKLKLYLSHDGMKESQLPE